MSIVWLRQSSGVISWGKREIKILSCITHVDEWGIRAGWIHHWPSECFEAGEMLSESEVAMSRYLQLFRWRLKLAASRYGKQRVCQPGYNHWGTKHWGLDQDLYNRLTVGEAEQSPEVIESHFAENHNSFAEKSFASDWGVKMLWFKVRRKRRGCGTPKTCSYRQKCWLAHLNNRE